MTNPFENEEISHVVLMNSEGQYSLWPEFADIPNGWDQVFGPAMRAECLRYVEENWTDMRPASLVRQIVAENNASA